MYSETVHFYIDISNKLYQCRNTDYWVDDTFMYQLSTSIGNDTVIAIQTSMSNLVCTMRF